jgi:hypothetical protein
MCRNSGIIVVGECKMTEKKKTRLSVPLSQKIYDQIVAEADKIGVSPATHCAHLIGSHLSTTNSLLSGINTTLTKELTDAIRTKKPE